MGPHEPLMLTQGAEVGSCSPWRQPWVRKMGQKRPNWYLFCFGGKGLCGVRLWVRSGRESSSALGGFSMEGCRENVPAHDQLLHVGRLVGHAEAAAVSACLKMGCAAFRGCEKGRALAGRGFGCALASTGCAKNAPTSVVHHGTPLKLACTPCGTIVASCSNELWMSLDHRTTPKRCPPAHRPRASTSGASPCSATGREKVDSQLLTHNWLKAAAGPKLVS